MFVKAADNVENLDVKKAVVKIDNTEPTISYTKPSSLGTNKYITLWAKSHSVSGISITDSHSGVKSKQYCWNTSASTPSNTDSCWTNIESLTTITKSTGTGIYYLHLRAEDNAGNVATKVVSTSIQQNCSSSGGGINKDFDYVAVKALNCSTVESYVNFKFDNEAPTITDLGIDSSSWEKSHTVSGMTFDDNNRSGVNDSTKKYCWSTSESNEDCGWTSFEGNSVTGGNVRMTGEYYLHVQVSDNVGNVGYAKTESKLKFDNKLPEVVSVSRDNDKYAVIHNVTVTVKDGHSGIKIIKYCVSSDGASCSGTEATIKDYDTAEKNPSSSLVSISNLRGTYYIIVWTIDDVGNRSFEKSSEIMYFKKSGGMSGGGIKKTAAPETSTNAANTLVNVPKMAQKVTASTDEQWERVYSIDTETIYEVLIDENLVVKYCLNQKESSEGCKWTNVPKENVRTNAANWQMDIKGLIVRAESTGKYYIHIYIRY